MRPRRIIIHHSATADSGTVSWGAIRRYHIVECVWGDIGYHFGVELVGDGYEILAGRMPDAPGAHTRGQNAESIGVCLVGNFDAALPPALQWQKGVELVAWLCRNFSIPAAEVRGHRDFANKSCPGDMFDMNRFRRDLLIR